MYLLQIKVEDGVVKELLGFQCFVIMFLDGDYIWITIKIFQIRLHLSWEKKHVNINKKTKKQNNIQQSL
jgi:hypothetical protein